MFSIFCFVCLSCKCSATITFVRTHKEGQLERWPTNPHGRMSPLCFLSTAHWTINALKPPREETLHYVSYIFLMLWLCWGNKSQTQNSNSKLKLKTQIQTQRSNTKNYFFSKNLKNIRFCDSFCSNMSYYHTFLFSLHERGGLGFIITLTHWKSNWYIIK